MGQDRDHCRGPASPAVQSEDGWVWGHHIEKPEIFTKDNAHPDLAQLYSLSHPGAPGGGEEEEITTSTTTTTTDFILLYFMYFRSL